MAQTYGPKYPGIKDGLIYCFDPLNRDCWSGGNTIHNAKGLQNITGSFITDEDGDEWSGAISTEGYVTYDQANDYFNLEATPTVISLLKLQEFTLSTWVNMGSMVDKDAGMFTMQDLGSDNGYALVVNFQFRFYVNNSTNTLKTVQGDTDIYSSGTGWYNVVCVLKANGLSPNQYMWVNGVEQTDNDTVDSVGYSTDTYYPKIGAWATHEMDGKQTCTMIYNRALSDTEITTNYNRLKGRFGL